MHRYNLRKPRARSSTTVTRESSVTAPSEEHDDSVTAQNEEHSNSVSLDNSDESDARSHQEQEDEDNDSDSPETEEEAPSDSASSSSSSPSSPSCPSSPSSPSTIVSAISEPITHNRIGVPHIIVEIDAWKVDLRVLKQGDCVKLDANVRLEGSHRRVVGSVMRDEVVRWVLDAVDRIIWTPTSETESHGKGRGTEEWWADRVEVETEFSGRPRWVSLLKDGREKGYWEKDRSGGGGDADGEDEAMDMDGNEN
ncbi:uncharacterized protein EI97DRAFT_455397 [Westerdykella ornata]|uniref:Uncharacterized protein n=1 Tax=Westerdykella ornata TaxID=318751 RepID=A0A6A6JVT4_WESOR|nr:uncharacterized protein EI97DRAFT_455397 [Westerdykella ornata]KAF2280507.1 hypothetical protein EI97DRAFT_455397 [Westerdykella ornata]